MPKLKNLFAHTQLNTDDRVKAKKFYKSLFAWKLTDVEMGPGMIYTNVDVGSRVSTGGIQEKEMADAPSMWLTYVQVTSVEKTIAKAVKLGAKTIVAYQPIPGMGAFGIFADPSGAALGVWEPGKKPAKRAAKKQSRRSLRSPRRVADDGPTSPREAMSMAVSHPRSW
jgi:uncharacterized protein